MSGGREYQVEEAPGALREGCVIAGRFTIVRLAGRGGMGVVYQARDAASGDLVALKVLRSDVPTQLIVRFSHEAQLLSELSHPAIVKHIAHGRTPDGEPYLAMTWLEGEELSARLTRMGLTPAESLILLRTVAEGLAVAHRRGVVHRDLKPGNLFLRGCDVTRATILDFGIAHRPQLGANPLTHTGAVIGTPGYMAPEQARGDRGIGPAADVFALGAILYECLTGQPPFAGEHIAAVLARILFTEPPSLRQLRPELPEALESLLVHMLRKDPASRLLDADAVLAALRDVGPLPQGPPRPSLKASTQWKLTHAEQCFACVLAAAEPRGPIDSDATMYPTSLSPDTVVKQRRIERSLAELGAAVEWLLDGTLLCSMARISHIADQARQVARTALFLARIWPQAVVVVATGQGRRSELSGLPIGAAFDQVIRMLRAGANPALQPGRVLLDELTTRFLDSRFHTEPQSGGLSSLRSIDEQGRIGSDPGGPRTPFVGRDPELQSLLTMYRTCRNEPVARAVLVTAPPGAGKTRLLAELRRKLDEEGDPIHWLTAQADPGGPGAFGGLLSQAVARFCGLEENGDADAQRRALKLRVASYVAAPAAAQVVAFLGELCGVPFCDEEHPALPAARLSPQIRSEQLGLAVLTLLGALSRERPTLIVLEDLHWGDEQTVRLLDTALRDLCEQPLFLLAFARPEVHEAFPKLWSERSLQELRLNPLSKRACEQLLRGMLGENVDGDVRARIIAQSSGNALFLEELIRAQKEGHADETPSTVLAMLQARLLRLAPEPRRVLRAASVFGAACWRDGIVALVGGEEDAAEVDATLQSLIGAEILERRPHSRLPRQSEYGFRHALMQQAAYSLLHERDRELGHTQVADFLVRSGAGDPAEIAGHYERGSERASALPYYLQAAQNSFEQLDLSLTLRHVDRARECGAREQPEALALVAALQCVVYRFQGEHARMMEAGELALSRLPPGSVWWFRIVFNLSLPLRIRGERARVVALAEQWAGAEPQPDAAAAHIEAGAWFTVMLSQMAEREAAVGTWHRLEKAAARLPGLAQYLSGLTCLARYEYLRVFAPDPWRQQEEVRTAAERLADSASHRDSCAAQISLGQARVESGDVAGGVQHLSGCIQTAERLRQPYIVLIAKGHLMSAMDQRAETADAAAKLASEILASAMAGDGFRGWSHLILGRARLHQGDLAAAAEHIDRAITLSGGSPLRRLHATSLRVHLLLSQGQAAAARALSDGLLREAADRGGGGYCTMTLMLAAIAARWHAGDREGAAELHASAAAEVRRRASLYPDETTRARYLSELPENAAVLSAEPWHAGVRP